MLSIIIPTLNEEDYLPLLLTSIKRQSFSDYEIIVADNSSKDRTREIAREYGCKVVDGGLPGKGRNEGAKAAQGDILLFFDADTILPPNFLKNILLEFKQRKLSVASCFIQPCGEKKIFRLLYNLSYNWPGMLVEKIFPFGSGFFIIERKLHEKIKGFDEDIMICEDTFYVKEASKLGKFRMLKSAKIFYSQRRFERDGCVITYLKGFFAFVYTSIFGPVKSDIFKYRFGHYSKSKKQDKIE